MTIIRVLSIGKRVVALALLLSFIMLFSTRSYSQTDVPRLITYQGQLLAKGDPISGEHIITAKLYIDREGTSSIWHGTYSAIVTDGIFAIVLGAGQYPLPGLNRLDKSLWVGISVDGGEELHPLTQLTASPYALNVPDKSITKAKLSDDVLEGINSANNTLLGTQETQSLGGDWSSALNDYSADTNQYLGTNTSGGDLEIRVHNIKSMRYSWQDSVPSVNGGYKTNDIHSNIGATISGGGGWSGTRNEVKGGWATVGGGSGNIAGDSDPGNYFQTVGGGVRNSALGDDATIAGGEYGIASGDESTIGGGSNNTASGHRSVVAGGYHNVAAGTGSFVGSGEIPGDTSTANNRAYGYSSAIVGGYLDSISTNGKYSTIAGGNHNTITDSNSVIVGGTSLTIGANSFGFNGQNYSANPVNLSGQSKIAVFNDVDILIGNIDNTARKIKFYEPNSAPSLTYTNHYTSFRARTQAANIEYQLPDSAGHNNQVLTTDASNNLYWSDKSPLKWYAESVVNPFVSPQATDTGAVVHGEAVLGAAKYISIGGGMNDTIFSGANFAVIAGGKGNKVSNVGSSIGGGEGNIISDTLDDIYYHSTISGGIDNVIESNTGVIGGGAGNLLWLNSWGSVIGGGHVNIMYGGSNGFIGGGALNYLIYNSYATVAGGYDNNIDSASNYGTIGGGSDNYLGALSGYSVISGGWHNKIISPFSFVGGGDSNFVYSSESVIAGGCFNTVYSSSYYSSIGGGCRNIADNTYATIGGGSHDTVAAERGTIGGGSGNLIDGFAGLSHSDPRTAYAGTIGGGTYNHITKIPKDTIPNQKYPDTYSMPLNSTIAGGDQNSIYGHFASITGGQTNAAFGMLANVIGGVGNEAYDFQTVTGTYARTPKILNNLSFYPSPPFDTARFAVTDFPRFIVGNGRNALNRKNAFEVSDSGHTTVFHVLGEGVNPKGSLLIGPPKNMYLGSTYVDNVIYASGDISPSLNDTLPNPDSVTVNFSFGVSHVHRVKKGEYEIKLNIRNPITKDTIDLTKSSVVASIVQPYDDSTGNCSLVYPSEIVAGNKFKIRIRYRNTCDADDRRFTFHVTGRP